MKGPVASKALVRPATSKAVRRVVNEPAFMAVLIMSKAPEGIMTASITWIIPFVHSMSTAVMLAPSIMTVVSTVIETLSPCSVWIELKATTSVELNAPDTTWYKRTSVRAVGFARSQFSTSVSSAAKASSVGAKTVKGPEPFNVELRPVASNALIRVVKFPSASAVSTMSSVG